MDIVLEASVSNDGTSVVTGSITPTSGARYFVCVVSFGGAAPTLVGTNGWNVTWSLIGGNSGGEVPFPGDPTLRLQWFEGIPSSSSAGTLTASGDGSTLSLGMHVVRTTADTSGSVVQSEENSASNDPTPIVTLAAFSNINNATIFGCVWNSTNTPTADSPLVQLAQSLWFFSSWKFATGAFDGNETTPSFTNASNINWAALGFEVKAQGAPPPTGLPFVSIVGAKRI